jgi:hypothetical protein
VKQVDQIMSADRAYITTLSQPGRLAVYLQTGAEPLALLWPDPGETGHQYERDADLLPLQQWCGYKGPGPAYQFVEVLTNGADGIAQVAAVLKVVKPGLELWTLEPGFLPYQNPAIQ